MHIHLETVRLVLRQFTLEDAADLLALDSDPEVMRYIGPNMLTSVEAARDMIRSRFLPYYDLHPGGYGFWAAQDGASGAFLGWFHLRPATDYRFACEAGYMPGEVDLGYRLRRNIWGQGLATEASRALIDKGFTEQNHIAVVSCALASNVASTRVMEKVGLRHVDIFTLPGYQTPLLKYALGREDWVQEKASVRA